MPASSWADRRVEGPSVKLVATFDDGQALFDAVCARGLEGVVAKRL